MNTPSNKTLRIETPGWEWRPNRYESLPGQMDLFGEERGIETESESLGELFETGRDLPGARERDQQIIWDIET